MITTTEIKVQYPVNTIKSYPFNIRYFENSDINVEIVGTDGSTLILTLDAVTDGFNVTAVNGQPENGATITTSDLYNDGETITIYRNVPQTQEAEFVRGGDLPPDVLNASLDRGVAISQQIESTIARSLICPISDNVDVTYDLPTVELRKNKVVGFDTDGNVIAIDVGGSGGLVGVNGTKGLEVEGGIISNKVDNSTIVFDSSGDFEVGVIRTDNIADNSITIDKITNDVFTLIQNSVHPIGCIYTSVNATNPASLLTIGTWTPFGSGKVLVGVDTDDTDFDISEKVGGDKTHTLSIDEIPNHTHDLSLIGRGGNSAHTQRSPAWGQDDGTTSAQTVTPDSVGGGFAHNNVQPYITVYMWKRVA